MTEALSSGLGGVPQGDIAVVGIGCRLPGDVDSPQQFIEFLHRHGDAICEVPADRWSLDLYYSDDASAPGKAYVRHGGFLGHDLYRFDPAPFGISPREAERVDPQQRLLLESAWDALEDAGMPIDQVRGRAIGVYVGAFTFDAHDISVSPHNQHLINAHTSTGSTMTVLSNRLSYTFDLRGPSMTIDTACSSSLVCIHLACQALRDGACEAALVGGVNVMMMPTNSIIMCKGQFLARDGRSKAFEASADGYGRGEGAGIVVLKPLARALADSDRIYAVIRASGVNQDGRTDGMAMPSSDAQAALSAAVCRRAGVDPGAVGYVEAHGTGTRAGDAAELDAISRVYCQGRAPGQPLHVGSVKTNIGHLEAAAGVAGFIKAVLSVQTRSLLPQRRLAQPSPSLPFDALRIAVAQEVASWPVPGPAVAAVNSFGYGGTNAHVIVAEPPPPRGEHPGLAARRPEAAAPAPAADAPLLVPLSAATAEALSHQAAALASWLERGGGALDDVVYTLARRRSAHAERAVAVVPDAPALCAALTALSRGEPHPQLVRGRARAPRKVLWVFTGMGPQWWGMGQELYRHEPAFRDAVDQADGYFRVLAGWSLRDEMLRDAQTSRMARNDVAQPANLFLQVGLVAVLRARGVEADGYLGHSVGELAAAWAAGSLPLADAVRVVYARSHTQQAVAGRGTLLAVGIDAGRARALLADHPSIAIAAYNAPTSLALAGPRPELDRVAAALDRDSVFHRFVMVEVAYHSPQMDGLELAFRNLTGRLRPALPERPLYSTTHGARVTAAVHDADYFWANIRQPVLFEAAARRALADGFDLCVEIGPHPVLGGALREIAMSAGRTVATTFVQRRGTPERQALASALATVHVEGAALDWSRLVAAGRLVALPGYAFQRERYWAESAAGAELRLGRPGAHAMLQRDAHLPHGQWLSDLRSPSFAWLADHRVDGATVFPAAGHVEALLAAARERHGDEAQPVLEDLRIEQPLVIPEHGAAWLSIGLGGVGGGGVGGVGEAAELHARVDHDRWTRHATARVRAFSRYAEPAVLELDPLRARLAPGPSAELFYRALAQRRLAYGPEFQRVIALWCGPGEALAELRGAPAAGAVLPAAVLDAALQVAIAAAGGHASHGPVIPVAIGRLRWRRHTPARVWVHATVRTRDDGALEADLVLCDPAGAVVADLTGLVCRPLAPDARELGSERRWLHAERWVVMPAAGLTVAGQRWAVLGDDGPLVAELTAHGVAAMAIARVEQLAELEVDHVIWVASEVVHDGSAAPDVGVALCAELASLATALVARRAIPRLTVVTRGAFGVAAEDDVCPAHTALAGLTRVIMTEHPQLAARVVDRSRDRSGHALVDPGADPSGDAVIDSLFAALEARGADRPGDAVTPRAGHPGGSAGAAGSHPRGIDHELPGTLADPGEADRPTDAVHALVRAIADAREAEVAVRGAGAFARRLERWTEPAAAPVVAPPAPWGARPCVLDIARRGQLDTLAFFAQDRRAPEADEVEIEVIAASLNFKDLMKAMGMLSSTALERTYLGTGLGMEAAGRVVRVGPEVRDLRTGDAVYVYLGGALASHVIARRAFVVADRDARDPLDTACYFGFLTAHYALMEAARLRAGEKVLIHSAAGGVGLAACQLALSLGAEVYATAGTADKRAMLAGLGIQRVYDSRTLDFADQIRRDTGGAGVDVVVNSLAGEALHKSLALLAPGGRFVELGKQDIAEGAALGLAAFNRSLAFIAVDLDRLATEKPGFFGPAVAAVMDGVRRGVFAALPREVFAPDRIADAFRRFATGQVIGKVVIDFRGASAQVSERPAAALRCRADRSYLVTGGLGGFGLRTASWLASSGARHVVLASRRGQPDPDDAGAVQDLRDRGVAVHCVALDVADADAVARLVDRCGTELPPLAGVFHAAMVLDDRPIAELDAGSLARVMAAKALGAEHLDRATRGQPIDYFVLYSSVSGLVGNPGQASYAAANCYLDGLAHRRRRAGLPATSVAFGAIGEVGVVARDAMTEAHLKGLGLSALPATSALRVLAHVLPRQHASIGVIAIDWQRWVRALPHTPWTRLERLLDDAPAAADSPLVRLADALRALPEAEHAAAATEQLRAAAARVFKMKPAALDPARALRDYGLDSLMAVELQAALEAAVGVGFTAMELLAGRSLDALVPRVLATVRGAAAEARPAAGPTADDAPAPSGGSLREITQLLGDSRRLRDYFLERICVQPPYFALTDLARRQSWLEATAPLVAPSDGDDAAVSVAEASRHLAILGSCAVRLDDARAGRIYYPVRNVRLVSTSAAAAGAALASARIRARSLAYDVRTSRARAHSELLGPDGTAVMAFEVEYHVIPEAEFAALFAAHARPTTESSGADPYGATCALAITELGSGLIGERPVVRAEDCLGHFVGYPALPASIMAREAVNLVIAAVRRHSCDPSAQLRVIGGDAGTLRFVFAGEPIRYVARRIETASGERWRCAVEAGGAEVAWFTMDLELRTSAAAAGASAVRSMTRQVRAATSGSGR